MKMKFGYFQIQKWMLQTECSNWVEKAKEKMESLTLVSMFPSWVIVLKLSKKVDFLQFRVDLIMKSKSVKTI